jgi:endonuclease III
MEALTPLPGVGRKTANVVLGHALGVPGLPVDRHVLRVAMRIGFTAATEPGRVEADLCALLPPERWTPASDVLILHGRRVCRPVPRCAACAVRADCRYYRELAAGGAAARPTSPARRAARSRARDDARPVRTSRH